jgi:hypothetical protein
MYDRYRHEWVTLLLSSYHSNSRRKDQMMKGSRSKDDIEVFSCHVIPRLTKSLAKDAKFAPRDDVQICEEQGMRLHV